MPSLIIGTRPLATETIPALLEQIDELLAESPADGEAETLARLERTLTDGYAHALVLEAERWRLEQRMSELASGLTDGNQELKSQELAQVSSGLATNAAALKDLRATLTRLRARATAVRGT